MKLNVCATGTALLPALVNSYMLGGPFMYGRPVIIKTRNGCCSPDQAEQIRRQQQQWMETRMSPEEIERSKDVIRQQQEWINRAVGMAADLASEFAQTERDKEDIRRQKAWLNRAFGLASDVASGSSSPRYEVDDSEEAFQVVLDVPGVNPEHIDIQVEEDGKVLTITGQRQLGPPSNPRNTQFSKSFSLDPNVEADKITAQINNGVLLVSAPKKVVKPEVKVRKIPIQETATSTTAVAAPTDEKADADQASPRTTEPVSNESSAPADDTSAEQE